MKKLHCRICIAQSSLILCAVTVLLGSAGCEQASKSTSGEMSGSSHESSRISDKKASTDEEVAESDPSKGPAPNIETKEVVVDVSGFLDVALHGRVESVRQAIEAGVDVNAADEQQRTALLLASFNGHTSVVKLLLEHGALLSHRDAMGRTALMFAATSANAETVKLLLDEGADVNVVDTGEGFTALMHAAAEGQVRVVQILMQHKADPTIRDLDGDTARDFATRNGHSEVVKLLAN